MIQTRQINFDASGLQIREAAEGEESRTLVGYALKFGTRSVNLTPWSSWREVYEILEPGCISMEMLNRQDVVFTAFHNREKVLGRCTNGKGTLRMSIDSVGLRIECEMPNTELGNEMLELVKRGDLCGMSFAYTTDEDDSENAVSYEREGDKDGKEVWLRHVKRIDNVYDVTVASSPAYEDTEISQRELFDKHLPKTDAEQQREKELQDKATVMRMRAKYYNTFNY
jgi:HK97 family phage prohead protease